MGAGVDHRSTEGGYLCASTMFENVKILAKRARSWFPERSNIVSDAHYFSRYAAELGESATDLCQALVDADTEMRDEKQISALTEKKVLDAQSKVTKEINISDPRAISSCTLDVS